MYTENLPDIFHLLEVSAQSGLLTLTPAKDAADSSWQANCLLREGKISELKICRPTDGTVLLEGAPAIDWLSKQKVAYWYFKEMSREAFPAPTPRPIARENTRRPQPAQSYQLSHPPAFDMGCIPLRTSLGTRQEVLPSQWSREHRTVFLLVDGKRSKAEILRLLPATSSTRIDLVLRDLASAGLIE